MDGLHSIPPKTFHTWMIFDNTLLPVSNPSTSDVTLSSSPVDANSRFVYSGHGHGHCHSPWNSSTSKLAESNFSCRPFLPPASLFCPASHFQAAADTSVTLRLGGGLRLEWLPQPNWPAGLWAGWAGPYLYSYSCLCLCLQPNTCLRCSTCGSLPEPRWRAAASLKAFRWWGQDAKMVSQGPGWCQFHLPGPLMKHDSYSFMKCWCLIFIAVKSNFCYLPEIVLLPDPHSTNLKIWLDESPRKWKEKNEEGGYWLVTMKEGICSTTG